VHPSMPIFVPCVLQVLKSMKRFYPLPFDSIQTNKSFWQHLDVTASWSTSRPCYCNGQQCEHPYHGSCLDKVTGRLQVARR
jgi:hypothetical protein